MTWCGVLLAEVRVPAGTSRDEALAALAALTQSVRFRPLAIPGAMVGSVTASLVRADPGAVALILAEAMDPTP